MEDYIKAGTNLFDHLTSQIKLLDLDEKTKTAIDELIKNIDDSGYIKNYDEVKSTLSKELEMGEKEIEEALEILKTKKNLRLVKIPVNLFAYRQAQKYTIKDLPFGTLIQDADKAELTADNFKVATSNKPTEKQIEDMLFAWKVVKHVGSNAIVVAKDLKTLGIGMGQTSRIASMEIALSQACDEARDAVIASDGFFPAVDNIHAAMQSRIGAIIQPGGSIKDADVIAESEKYEIAMIMTGLRHFKH